MRSFRVAIAGVACFFGLSVAAEIVQPPLPTGPYAVGTVSRHVIDSTRGEDFTDAPDDHRELMIQFWYPAEGTEGKETTPYLPTSPEVRKALFTQLMVAPARVDELMGSWRTRGVEGAVISSAQKQYPVVLFSHGFGGFRGQNLAQMEELASRGYIVVAIDHTFCASAVEFPGGRVVLFDDEFKQPPNPDRAVLDKRYDDLARLWGADASFVIDELERFNAASGDPFAGRLNLDKIGMFGHSFGGATSGQMCLRDARVKCGINMDGRPYGDSRFEGVTRPFMVLCMVRGDASPSLLALAKLTQEQYRAIVDDMMGEFDRILRAAPEAYLVEMTTVDHYNFADFPYYAEISPISKNVVGTIDPARGGKIVNGYVTAFFGKYLRDESTPTLAADAKHEPEVTFTVFGKE